MTGGAIKDPAHTGTSKGLSQAINRGPIRKFLPKYANVYVTVQSHGLSTGARTHYVTGNEVRNRLGERLFVGRDRSLLETEWLSPMLTWKSPASQIVGPGNPNLVIEAS